MKNGFGNVRGQSVLDDRSDFSRNVSCNPPSFEHRHSAVSLVSTSLEVFELALIGTARGQKCGGKPGRESAKVRNQSFTTIIN